MKELFFQILQFTICFFFFFFIIFDIFFFYFTCLWFSKKNKNFCVVLLYGSEILSKNFAKLWFFCSKKNWDNWNPKFQQNSIVYNFFFIFLAFRHFVFYFTYPNLSKNYRIFCSILLEGLEILPTISWIF